MGSDNLSLDLQEAARRLEAGDPARVTIHLGQGAYECWQEHWDTLGRVTRFPGPNGTPDVYAIETTTQRYWDLYRRVCEGSPA